MIGRGVCLAIVLCATVSSAAVPPSLQPAANAYGARRYANAYSLAYAWMAANGRVFAADLIVRASICGRYGASAARAASLNRLRRDYAPLSAGAANAVAVGVNFCTPVQQVASRMRAKAMYAPAVRA